MTAVLRAYSQSLAAVELTVRAYALQTVFIGFLRGRMHGLCVLRLRASAFVYRDGPFGSAKSAVPSTPLMVVRQLELRLLRQSLTPASLRGRNLDRDSLLLQLMCDVLRQRLVGFAGHQVDRADIA